VAGKPEMENGIRGRGIYQKGQNGRKFSSTTGKNGFTQGFGSNLLKTMI
jgi:hypothetical protein